MAPSPTLSPSAGSSFVSHAGRFALAALATWRATHLITREDGPGEVIAIAREKLGDRSAGALMDCFYCSSLWVAMPFAVYAAKKPADRAVACLALSAAACFLNTVCERREETHV